MKPLSTFSFIVVLFMAIIVFVFDEKIATDLFHQHEAVLFPATTGRVYHSAVNVTHGSKGGTSYHINILYDYQVDGQSFHGSTFRYGLFSPGSAQAYAAVHAHPVGSEVTVYYRADDPSDSLLSPGVVGRDFLIFFILMPASLLVLYLLCTSNTPAWFKPVKPLAGGVQIISQGGQIRVRLPRYPVPAWSLAVFSGASVVSFVTLSLLTTRNPSVQPEAMAGILILAATVVVFWWRRARLLSGVDDLVFDESARTVSLPQTFGRNRATLLEFNAVRSVYLETIVHRGKGGYYYSWAVTFALQGAAASPERLAIWYDEEKCLAFAGWLCERLHLPGLANQTVDSSSAFSLSSSVGWE
ncbi:MAG TPA: DUF3592 domain-containing protein [Verrucomicrobiae bacterium]|jgi:hypothetical protein|nr:DUF3592 domain-containing protein [Verrucomicrobiae bacterium]